MIRDLKTGASKIERIGKIAFDLSTLTANRLAFSSKEVVKLQDAVVNWLSTEHVELLKLVCRLALLVQKLTIILNRLFDRLKELKKGESIVINPPFLSSLCFRAG